MAKRFFYVCAGIFLLFVSYHFGARRAVAQTAVSQEIALLSGVIGSGELLPLPRYQDGTEALESECRWIVSLHSTITEAGGNLFCNTDGRRVSSGTNNRQSPANFLIIAVRNLEPTPAQQESFGSVKARYR